MNLKEYFLTRRGEQMKMANALGVSKSQMSQMVSGICAISEKRCVLIENLTTGLVSRKDLRPSDWRDLWPELAEQEKTKSERAA